jgi:hypothetical protein
MSFGGNPDNSPRPTLAAGMASALDEITKRQCVPFLIHLHDMEKISGETVRRILGIPPMRGFIHAANTVPRQ